MRGELSWQLILADLALILFVCTLAGLAGAGKAVAARSACEAQFAQSHALYRAVLGAPPIGSWLAEQPADPRARLTIFGFYLAADHSRVTRDAMSLEQAALEAGALPRTVIEPADQSQVFASLAFDGELPGAAACLTGASSPG